jgi:hypothetical protein
MRFYFQISVFCISLNLELRKNCTRRKRHHELATARRTSNFDNDYRLRREYRIVILDRRLSSGRPFYRYPLPSPKGIPYRHPRSEVIIRSPLSSREVIIELFPFSLLTPFVRGRSSPLSFLSYPSFLKFTKLFGFTELPEFSKFFGVLEVFLDLPSCQLAKNPQRKRER